MYIVLSGTGHVEYLEMPENPIRGEITLEDYVAGLVRASQRLAS